MVFEGLRWALVIGGVLWSLQLLIPWSSWLAVGSFTGVVALFYENSMAIAHTYNLAVLLLFIHAAWYHFRRHEIRAAIADGSFWHREMYPPWVFKLSVFSIAIFHTFAGLSKLFISGFEWANGLSLQLWVHLWGVDSGVKELLLSDRALAQALQVSTLVIETGAIVALLSRRWRWAMGLGLMGLYSGILMTFNFNFQYNALIVALFLLPTYAALDWVYKFLHDGRRLTLRLRPDSAVTRVLRLLLSRLDILGVIEIKTPE
tara:strand:- start:98 stop:877 length:780 start_codon:yes stop_codon:yes gene_type:complete